MNALDSRPNGRTLSELLPYLRHDDATDILWLKDGSATKTFGLVPRNTMSFTDEDLEILRLGLTGTVNQLPEGSMLQLIMIRERTDRESDAAVTNWEKCHSDADLEETAENKTRVNLYRAKDDMLASLWESKALFQTRVYVTVRVAPEVKIVPSSKTSPLSFLNFAKRKTQLKPESMIAKEVDELFSTLKLAFDTQGFETLKVNSKEKLKLIYEYLNPERTFPDNFSNPSSTDLSESVALTDFIETKRGLKLGKTSLHIGSLKSLPDNSIPCLLTPFSTQTVPFVFVETVLVLSQSQEKERLTRRQRLASGMASGNAVRNLVAEAQLQDIEQTLSTMIGSGEKLFAASFHIIVQEKDSVETNLSFETLLAQGERIGAGCQWFEETVGAYPVFFGTLPFAPTFITRPKRLLSGSLADFLPIYGIGPGHDEASVLFETPYQSAIGFSLYEKSPSANAILIGSTGSGKSTLACGLILGMTAGSKENAPSCFVIDVGNSFKRTVLYLGGSSLDLSPEKGSVINPFDLETDETRPSPEKVKFLTALFDEVLGEAGNLTKLQRSLLETEILDFYESGRERTLTNFRKHLERSDEIEIKRLSKLLTLWCRPHPYGLLFDGNTNVDLNAPHLHFELRGCQRYPDLLRVAMLVVMDLVLRKVKSRFPRRSLVPVDECHTIIRPSSDGRANNAARWVEDAFRQMRKFSGSAIAISQTAKDLKNAEIGDGILANAPNRFILRQRGDEKTLKEDLKLNEQELKDVFSLSQVRGSFSEFYLHSESIKALLLYRPTPLELWLSTTHPPDTELLDKEAKANPHLDLPQLMDHMAAKYPQGAEGDVAA